MTSSTRNGRALGCLILLAPISAGVFGAYAQSNEDTRVRHEQALETADANDDGLLTLAELTTSLENSFARMDRNGDGHVSEDDAPRLARSQFMSRVGPVIEERDENGDGVLSYSEFSVRPLENFDSADTDDDASVEVAALLAVIRSRAAAQSQEQ